MLRLSFILILFLSSCCASKGKLSSGASLGAYNFSYTVERPSQAGIIQAFDDGINTFIKVFPESEVSFQSASKSPLEIKATEGNLNVLSGIHDTIFAFRGDKSSKVIRGIESEAREAGCGLDRSPHL